MHLNVPVPALHTARVGRFSLAPADEALGTDSRYCADCQPLERHCHPAKDTAGAHFATLALWNIIRRPMHPFIYRLKSSQPCTAKQGVAGRARLCFPAHPWGKWIASSSIWGHSVSSKSEKVVLRERERLKRAMVAVAKASREDKDLSRQALADRLGLTYSQVVNIEHGRRAISFEDFVLLAKAIGVEPSELLKRVLSW
jgi:DNA-binding XRE family transcriptional regulator